jgi:hypothetical protein
MINILQRRNQVVPQQNDIWTKFDALFVGERYTEFIFNYCGKLFKLWAIYRGNMLYIASIISEPLN